MRGRQPKIRVRRKRRSEGGRKSKGRETHSIVVGVEVSSYHRLVLRQSFLQKKEKREGYEYENEKEDAGAD